MRRKSVRNSRKKLVFVGFSAACLSDERAVSELRLLIDVFRHQHHCAVAVPVGVSLKETGIKGVTRVRSPKSLVNDPRLRLCVFLTLSLFRQDTALEGQLDGAKGLQARHLGCIFKPPGDKLITTATFEMFRMRDIEYATAVHTHADILSCVKTALS